MARGATGEVVGKVIVRRDPRPRTDPDAPERIARAEVDRVRRLESVEVRRNVDRPEIDGAVLSPLLGRVDPREDVGQPAGSGAEIHCHIGVVEEPSVMPRRADRHGERPVARVVQQMLSRRAPRNFPGRDQRPAGDEAAQDKGLARALQQRVEPRPLVPIALRYPRKPVINGAVAFSHGRACGSCARSAARTGRARRAP